jgi:hypothetical protein
MNDAGRIWDIGEGFGTEYHPQEAGNGGATP